MGELKTARFSAEAMAARLEEMNALSIRVGGAGCHMGCHMGCRVPCWQVAPEHSAHAVGCLVSGHPPTDHAAVCVVHPPVQVASLKLELAALKSEQDIREDELLGQIASLQVGAAPASPVVGICCKKASATRLAGAGLTAALSSGPANPRLLVLARVCSALPQNPAY